MLSVETAKAKLNAQEKFKYIEAEFRFMSNLTKDKALKRKTLIRQCASLSEKVKRAYNSYFSFVFFSDGMNMNMATSKEFSSPYGTILFFPAAYLYDIYFLSHSVDRYEQRCNEKGSFGMEAVYSNDTSLSRIARAIYDRFRLNEIMFNKIDSDTIRLKIDGLGIFVISRINGVYLVRTFLSLSMVKAEWRELAGSEPDLRSWLDAAFKL
jgi:hypothetical protein